MADNFYDAFADYQLKPYRKRHQRYNIEQGSITFFTPGKYEPRNDDYIHIYYIEVREELRRRGIFKNLLIKLSENLDTFGLKGIVIVAVSSFLLDNILKELKLQGKNFEITGECDFTWRK